VLSVALLLEHLGHADEARRVERAVADDLAQRGTAPRSTDQVAEALLSRLG
jgi:3-isopropylmalate dehydrogenase